MKKTSFLATVVAVGLSMMGSSLCQAQEAPDKKQKQFDKLDADKNGSVSLEEFSASKAKTPKPKKPAAPAQE